MLLIKIRFYITILHLLNYLLKKIKKNPVKFQLISILKAKVNHYLCFICFITAIIWILLRMLNCFNIIGFLY